MLKIRLLIAITFCLVASEKVYGIADFARNNDETTKITVDSIGKSYSNGVSSSDFSVDYPRETTGVVGDSIKAWISETLAEGANVFYWNEDAKLVMFKGDLSDGKALVNFYSKNSFDSLVAMQVEDRKYGGNTPAFSNEVNLRKVEETRNFVSYRMSAGYYTGGAHGGGLDYGQTFSKKDGHKLDYPIDTTKVAELQALLWKGIADYRMQNREEGVTYSMIVDEVKNMFEDFNETRTIPLPALTPYLTSKGMVFVYQQYEIMPYAAGMPEFTIPYEYLLPYMTEDALRVAGFKE